MGKGDQEQVLMVVTDLKAVEDNAREAVDAFARQYLPMPRFDIGVEVMTLPQLRDAMGLHSVFEYGDPWPAAEQLLMQHGFRWHRIGGVRAMLVRERDNFIPDTGWEDAETV